MSDTVKKVVIAGGGTAGWMSAAALARGLDGLGISIVLVESEEIGAVGVGEATIPIIHQFNQMLGVNHADFMRATHGTYKLGIEFVDWSSLGSRYIHPFSIHGRDSDNLSFHQLWLKHERILARRGEATKLDDFNVCSVAAKLGRFRHPVSGEKSRVAQLNYAFHFDASLYAQFLRRYAEDRGVVRQEGKIASVQQNGETGFITGLTLESGMQIEGDMFVDCTGFRGVLIEGALKAGYEEWTHWLPCDRAIAVPCASDGPPIPYTRATAREAGWQWRIPLQHRIGNGYVYSSAHIDDDEAEKLLLGRLDGATLAPPRRLRFVTGRRREFWKNNCVAIGLASGFMEPLESTSIHLIHTAILKFLSLFPTRDFAPAERATFNAHTAMEYENIRDFLVLHYKATMRDDTPFWRHCRDMAVPDSLTAIMDLFRATGRMFVSRDGLFNASSWLAVMVGQEIMPRDYDPLVDRWPDAKLEAFMRETRQDILAFVERLPPHEVTIQQVCGARPIADVRAAFGSPATSSNP